MEINIVGYIENDKYLEKIKKIIKNKKLENVVIAGFKTGQDLIDEYKRSSFFVSASKSENFGLSIAEALKSGLPCIVPKNLLGEILQKINVDSHRLLTK